MNMITSKKITASMIIAVLLIGLVTPVFAATKVTGSAKVKTKTMIYASNKSTQLAEICAGQSVTIKEKDGNYYKVTWQGTGYAHKNYMDSNGNIKNGGPNIYPNAKANSSERMGDIRSGKVTIKDKSNKNYYKVSFSVSGYIKIADLKDVKINENKKTTESKGTTGSTESAGSLIGLLGGLLKIGAKGLEIGADIGGSLFSGLLSIMKERGEKNNNTLTINPTKITLKVGQTTKITAKINGSTVTPTRCISDDENVVTVDKSGKVTAGKKTGTAKITVYYGLQTATCNVTVNDSTNSYTYEHNGKQYKLAVTEERLCKTVDTIQRKNLIQQYEPDPKDACDNIANYHIQMLLGRADGNTTITEIVKMKDNSGTSRGNSLSNLKKCIDEKKPARLHVLNGKTEHWVTVVGYKNNGQKFSDFLIISTYYGQLINGGQGDAPAIYPNDSRAIRVFN